MRMLALILVASPLALAACAVPVQTLSDVAPSCHLPAHIEAVPAEIPPADQIVHDVPVAYYVLAMTWSPEWCRTRADRPTEKLQCVDNQFGWVLHGLWPNGKTAPHPRYCKPSVPLRAETVRRHLCRTPSAELLQHEWAAHGTCAWRNPEEYFDEAADLRSALRMPSPEVIALGVPSLTVAALRAAIVDANTGLPAAAIAVDATRDGRLYEVNVCYNLAFRFMACPSDASGEPDDRVLAVQPSGPAAAAAKSALP